MPLDSWLWLIAAALITGFGAFYLLTHATKRLKAGELAAISYQETIMASLLGLCLFGETLTAFQLIGGALIVIGGVSRSSSPPVRRTKKSTMPLLMAKWPWRPSGSRRCGLHRCEPGWNGSGSWLLWPTAPRKLPTLTIGIILTPTTAKSPAFAEGLAGEVRVRPSRLRTCQMGLLGRKALLSRSDYEKLCIHGRDGRLYLPREAREGCRRLHPRWCARTAWQPYGHVRGRRLTKAMAGATAEARSRPIRTARSEGIVCSAINFGYRSQQRSGGGFHLSGTTSLSGTTIISLARDICYSLIEDGARKIVFMNGHYENYQFIFEGAELALEKASAEGIKNVKIQLLSYWDFVDDATIQELYPDGFTGWDLEHAGVMETSSCSCSIPIWWTWTASIPRCTRGCPPSFPITIVLPIVADYTPFGLPVASWCLYARKGHHPA